MSASLRRNFKCFSWQQIRSISSTSQVADTQIDNNKAMKLMNYLYVNNKKKSKYAYKTVEEALGIYHKLTEIPSYETIDTLLKLMFDFQNPRKYANIWGDIRNASELISYPLLIKCCIQCRRINTSNCIEILSWMKASSYCLRINNLYIQKLVIHCSQQNDVESLDFIYSLFEDGLIENDALFIKTIFISAYSKCGKLQKSEDIFNGMDNEEMDMDCIESMMNAFSNNDCYLDALVLYDRLDCIANKRIFKNNHCDSMALQACIQTDDYSKGQQIHEFVNKKLYDKGKSHCEMNDEVRCSLVRLYGHFGDVKEAKFLFKSMRNHHCNFDALNSMMTAFISNNDYESALNIYKHGIERNETSNILAIRCCTKTKNYILGKRIYENYLFGKIKNKQVKLKNELIKFFGACGEIESAQSMFDSMLMNKRRVDAETIGLMMDVLMDNDESERALELYFDRMEEDDDDEDDEEVKYIGDGLLDAHCHRMAIRACIDTNDLDKGDDIIAINGMLDDDYFDDAKEEDVHLKNSLIDFYGCFGDLDSAQNIFDGMQSKNDESMASMMRAFIKNDENENALQLYEERKESECTAIVHGLAINAAANLRDIERGKKIHEAIGDSVNEHIEIKHALIQMYADMDVQKALELFEDIEDKDKTNEIVECILSALRKNKRMKECVSLFEEIKCGKYESVQLSLACFVNALMACKHDGIAFEIGRSIHESLRSYTEGFEWMLQETAIRIALIDMYSRHGQLDECLKIFGDPSHEKEGNVWKALIEAFEKNATCQECDELKNIMIAQSDVC